MIRIENRFQLKQVRAECQAETKQEKCRVLICGGTGCLAGGSAKLYEHMKELAAEHENVQVEIGPEIAHIGVHKSGCHGFCEMGPLMRIEPYGYLYLKVQESDCGEIFEKTVLRGQPVERLMFRQDNKVYPSEEEIPFYAKQTRLVLKNCGHIDAERIEAAIAAGAYEGLEKALFEMTPKAVIQAITDSKLRGRGGAGFPAGKKWSQVAAQKETVRYVVCNGDEGDPGAEDELKANAQKLVDTLESFGVRTRVLDISRGPSVTRYEVQPMAGVKISRITSLADDIALNLAVADVRMEAPIPGKPAVGIEVPNHKKTPVFIRSVFESQAFLRMTSPLGVALGKDIAGVAQVADLCKMPHLLIAGSTGSGKSVCVNSIIISILFRSSPEDVKLMLIDPKVVELAEYNGIPHLLMPVITEPKKAAGALSSAVQEMERRYHLFAENNVRDIKSFNKLAATDPMLEKMPYIAIIIDELADLMMVVGKDVEDSICRIAQKARAAGMHLIVATQRPSVDVITGLIKANIPSRIAFAVSSQVDSRTILDGAGAEKLLGQGDMLFMPVGAPKPVRIQGTFVRDEEISRVLDFIKQSATVQYDEAMIEAMEKHAIQDGKKGASSADADEETGSDPMLKQAVEVVIDAGQASTSLLQRRCKLGYARAARIMDEMEQKGIIGPYEGAKPRAVLISRQQWLEMQMNQPDE